MQAGWQLVPGQILEQGRFVVERALSKGGMGAIYLADQRSLDRKVVLKVSLNDFDSSDSAANKEAYDLFKAEAHTLAKLKHENIAQIYEFFMHDKKPVIVMEYVDGKSLEEYLTHTNDQEVEVYGKAFPIKQIVDWGIILCGVLEYLGAQKPDPIVHHDIKPANIILTENKIKLVDFGASKIRRASAAGKFGKTTVYGTPGYAPLEQFRGISEPRSDVYALAATLYHLATNKRPSTFITEAELEGLGDLGKVLIGALKHDVSERVTASALKQELHKFAKILNEPRLVKPQLIVPERVDFGRIPFDGQKKHEITIENKGSSYVEALIEPPNWITAHPVMLAIHPGQTTSITLNAHGEYFSQHAIAKGVLRLTCTNHSNYRMDIALQARISFWRRNLNRIAQGLLSGISSFVIVGFNAGKRLLYALASILLIIIGFLFWEAFWLIVGGGLLGALVGFVGWFILGFLGVWFPDMVSEGILAWATNTGYTLLIKGNYDIAVIPMHFGSLALGVGMSIIYAPIGAICGIIASTRSKSSMLFGILFGSSGGCLLGLFFAIFTWIVFAILVLFGGQFLTGNAGLTIIFAVSICVMVLSSFAS